MTEQTCEYAELMKGTEQMLEESRKETKPYIWEVLGEPFVVLPGVFSPKYFKDTEFFAECVPKYVKGPNFLEIGGGTGIVSHFVGANNESVNYITCTDITKNAIKNSKLNDILYESEGLSRPMTIYESDIYDGINGVNDKFDSIFWNVPFGDWSNLEGDLLKNAVYDKGYAKLKRFIAQSKEHFKWKGPLLIGFSTTLGKYDKLERLLDKHFFEKPKLLAETTSTEGNPNAIVKFELFETYAK